MPLENIPVITLGQDAALSGNAPALLRETVAMVQRLLATGETSAIDLKAMPLTPADRDWLQEKFGAGEISVTLQADGESTLSETGCPGVWWVTHRNEHGAATSEFIEVAFVPELVKAHPADVAMGLEHLEMLISDLS